MAKNRVPVDEYGIHDRKRLAELVGKLHRAASMRGGDPYVTGLLADAANALDNVVSQYDRTVQNHREQARVTALELEL